MNKQNLTLITILYYQNESLELFHTKGSFPKNADGRVIIPQEFKKDKTVIAVCEGDVNIMNKMGDRILPVEIQSVKANKSISFNYSS